MLAQMIKETGGCVEHCLADPDEILVTEHPARNHGRDEARSRGMSVVPDKVWIDGNRVPKDLNVPAEAVVKGDSKIIEISAASVLAKTARDAEMYELAKRYPQYGFDRHKATARRNTWPR